jgi:hypothetical protein
MIQLKLTGVNPKLFCGLFLESLLNLCGSRRGDQTMHLCVLKGWCLVVLGDMRHTDTGHLNNDHHWRT